MSIDYDDVEQTELVWPGKRTEVDRVRLPFQTVETLSEPRMDQRRLDTEEWPENYPRDWKNRLIWGDNKYIMSSLLEEFAGEIDLIYIDPPFATGADFSIDIEIGEDLEATKEPSVIEEHAYRDTWGQGLQSYLQMMYHRLCLMRDLLRADGALFVHCDWRVNSYLRVILDRIFGWESLLNEIIWKRRTGGTNTTGEGRMGAVTDTILVYAASENTTLNQLRSRHGMSKEEINDIFNRVDESGRRFRVNNMTSPNPRPNLMYEYRGRPSPKNGWAVSREKMRQWDQEGRLYFPDNSKLIYRKEFLDEWEGRLVQSLWTDIPFEKNTVYATQKPQLLMERVLKLASSKGDLIADFFCGSGTTGLAAETLGRRWIMSDLSKYAIHTTRKRLLNLHSTSDDYAIPVRPFAVQNLGSYQKYKFTDNGHPPVEDYRTFVLELYDAEELDGYSFIHGRRGNNFVHIAGVDSIVTVREIQDAAEECRNSVGGDKLDVLAWDYELGLDQEIPDIENTYGLTINPKYIPREAGELKSAAEADERIRFYDMSYLELDWEVDGQRVRIDLADFMLANPKFIPKDVRERIRDFADYIDYWAVDFDYQDDTFHNGWQSFRTRQDRSLDTRCVHHYETPGRRTVLVKVIDIFGNDTNRAFEVNIDEHSE